MQLYEVKYRTPDGKVGKTLVPSDFMSTAVLKAIATLPPQCTVIAADLARFPDDSSHRESTKKPSRKPTTTAEQDAT